MTVSLSSDRYCCCHITSTAIQVNVTCCYEKLVDDLKSLANNNLAGQRGDGADLHLQPRAVAESGSDLTAPPTCCRSTYTRESCVSLRYKRHSQRICNIAELERCD